MPGTFGIISESTLPLKSISSEDEPPKFTSPLRSERLVTSNDVVLVFPVTSIPLDLTCNFKTLLKYKSTVPCGLIVTPLPTFTTLIFPLLLPSVFAFISILLLFEESIFKVEPLENIDLPVPKLIDLLSIILSVSLNVDTPD